MRQKRLGTTVLHIWRGMAPLNPWLRLCCRLLSLLEYHLLWIYQGVTLCFAIIRCTESFPSAYPGKRSYRRFE